MIITTAAINSANNQAPLSDVVAPNSKLRRNRNRERDRDRDSNRERDDGTRSHADHRNHITRAKNAAQKMIFRDSRNATGTATAAAKAGRNPDDLGIRSSTTNLQRSAKRK